MTKCYFITGTNTDIGKTVITAGLSLVSSSLGLKTAVMKPVQTGIKEYEEDLNVISRINPNLIKSDENLHSPYKFNLASSPHLAADMEGMVIDRRKIIKSFLELRNTDIDTLLVEGAGGIYVPITGDYFMLDLIADLQIPVIIVTTTELGTINHTLLTINALRAARIETAGIVFNKVPKNLGLIARNNIDTIKKLGNVNELACVKLFEENSAGEYTQLLNEIKTEKTKELFI